MLPKSPEAGAGPSSAPANGQACAIVQAADAKNRKLALPLALTNPVDVLSPQLHNSFIGGLLEPGFKLRGSSKRLALLVAETAENMVSQLSGIGGKAR